MLDKGRIFLYLDRVIITFLCLLFFCLPFSKAGVESFVWPAIFIFILKRALGYRCGSLWGMFPNTGLNKALGIFIAVNLLSVIFSVDLALSLRGFFGKQLKFLAIFFMLVEVINSRKRLKIILIAIITSVVFIIVDAGVQYFKGVDFLRGYRAVYHSFSASFPTATGFAAWLILIIPLFIGLIASNILPNLKLRVLLFISVIIQFFYLVRTFSRGAWLGFIIAIIMMFCYFINSSSLRSKVLYLFVVTSLLAGYLFLPHTLVVNTKESIVRKFQFSQTVSRRLKSTLKTGEGSTPVRFKLWKEALRITGDYSFIGCGLNTYSKVARKYKSFDCGGVYPHNSYLQMAAETGLFGLGAFLCVLSTFFIIGLRYLNQKRDYLVLGLLSGILAFLVHAFFDVHLYSLQLVVLFWYMLGLTMAVIRLEADAHQNPGG